MSDIDFLANKKGDDQESKNQADKKEKIIWSEPDEDKPLSKEAPFYWLPFLNKKKETKRPASALGSKIEPKPMADKNKIRESRREILKLIKHHQASRPKETKEPRQGLLAGLIERLKPQPRHKEVLIDYQQIFNQEKIKRNLIADRLSASKFASPAHLAGKAAVENKLTAARGFKDSFFSRFLKMIKAMLAAAKRPKPRPAKINPVAMPKNIKPLVVPPPVKSAPKEEKEIKKKPLEPEAPAKIEEAPMEVLETNLIKGEIINFFDWRRKIVILINAIFIPVFIIAVIYFGLAYYQQQNRAKAQEQIKRSNELTAEINQAEIGLKEITDFQARLKTVSQIFAQHIYWTNFFKFLEDNTMKDVYYAGFSGDTSGTYSLDAMTSRFSDISKQVGILSNNDKITDVSTMGGEAVSGEAGGKGGVKFNLDFSILKSIFTE